MTVLTNAEALFGCRIAKPAEQISGLRVCECVCVCLLRPMLQHFHESYLLTYNSNDFFKISFWSLLGLHINLAPLRKTEHTTIAGYNIYK